VLAPDWGRFAPNTSWCDDWGIGGPLPSFVGIALDLACGGAGSLVPAAPRREKSHRGLPCGPATVFGLPGQRSGEGQPCKIPLENQGTSAVSAAGFEPTTPGSGVREKTSQGVAGGSKPSRIQQVADGDPSRGSPGFAPNIRSFGAIVVQDAEAGGSGSRPVGPYLTVREVAARLRVCTATAYRLCDTGKLAHIRVSNAVRVSTEALRKYLRGCEGRGGRVVGSTEPGGSERR